MTQEDKKRLILRELSALERLGAGAGVSEKLEKLQKLAELYYSVGQYQEACNKYHDFRTLGVRQGLLDLAGACEARLKEAWCNYERGDFAQTEETLRAVDVEIEDVEAVAGGMLSARSSILHGYLSIRRGRYKEALLRCDKAFQILQRTDDHKSLAKVQICYGHGFFRTGDFDRAREYYEDALASARRGDDSTRLVQATINLALVCKEQNDTNRALYLLEQANGMLKESGGYSLRGHTLLNMAVIHFHRGNLQLAEESYRDSLRIYLQTGQQQGVVLARIGIARIQALRGANAEAEKLMAATLDTCRDQGYLREEILLRRDLGDIRRATGDLEGALERFDRAMETARPLGEKSEHTVQIGRRIGVTQMALGRWDEAEHSLRQALLTARRVGENYEEAVILCALGTQTGLKSQWGEWEKMYKQGLDMLRRMGERIELGKALVRHVRTGIDHPASEVTDLQLELAEARRIFVEAGVPPWIAKARLEEARLLSKTGDTGESEKAMAEAQRIFAELNDSRLLDQVDALRRSMEDQMVDRSVSRRNDHLAIHDLLPPSSTDFDLKSLLEELVERTDGDRGMFLVFNAEGKPVERALHGMRQQNARKVIEALSPIFDQGSRELRPFLSTAVASDPRISGRVLANGGSVRSLLIVPFQTNADISGAIYLDREDHRHPFASRELDMVVGLVRSQRFVLTLLSTRQKELEEENTRLRRQVLESGRFDEIVTQSDRMYEVLELVRKVATTNVTVLIQGETGTGKQLVTKAIHSESLRKDRQFYSINCATLPEQLLESELFGHVAGSFTGAMSNKVGLLVEASSSTVFLDEIDKMNIQVQSKLLHVLEEKRIRPIGSNSPIDVDCRFLCASNRNLLKEVKAGNFLEDLYYRLNVIKIDLPPLRDRLEDVLLLSQYFLRIFSAEMSKDCVRLDEQASQALLRHNWPGNVRELRSEMRRVVVLNDGGPVSVDALSGSIRGDREGMEERVQLSPPRGSASGSLKGQVSRYERELLVNYLERFDGNVSRMARELNLSRWGLHKKLEKHGLR